MLTEVQKQELNRLLRKEAPVEVTFIKKSTGKERVMVCSQFDAYLPETKGYARTSNPEKTAIVVDLDINEYRSFNYETVTGYKVIK